MFVIYQQNLNSNSLPVFLDQLANVTEDFTEDVVGSTATVTAVVDILSNVGETTMLSVIPITKTSMEVCQLIQKCTHSPKNIEICSLAKALLPSTGHSDNCRNPY